MDPNHTQNQLKKRNQPDQEKILKKIIYFAGVPKATTKHSLINYFSKFGLVLGASFMKHKDSRQKNYQKQELHRGCGTVSFCDSNGATRAVNCQHRIGQQDFMVRYYYPEPERRKMEMEAIEQRRKIHIDGVPFGFPEGKKDLIFLFVSLHFYFPKRIIYYFFIS